MRWRTDKYCFLPRLLFFIAVNAAVYFVFAVTVQDVNIFPHMWNQDAASDRFVSAVIAVLWIGVSTFFSFAM